MHAPRLVADILQRRIVKNIQNDAGTDVPRPASVRVSASQSEGAVQVTVEFDAGPLGGVLRASSILRVSAIQK